MAGYPGVGASAGGRRHDGPVGSTTLDENGQRSTISPSTLLRILPGVVAATKCTSEAAQPIAQWIVSLDTVPEIMSQSLQDWLARVDTTFPGLTEVKDDSRHIARLVVVVAFLREISRWEATASSADLDLIWSVVRDALTSTRLTQPLCAASRSAQGFLSVPLCSILKDGNIDELFRLHVWLPGDLRGNVEFKIHSHQPFGQSWILAGEGTDHPHVVEPVDIVEGATHAKYALSWTGEERKKRGTDDNEVQKKQGGSKSESDGEDVKDGDSTYKTYQTKSTVRNTGKYIRATALPTETHGRGSSYSIPAAAYHWTEVQPGAFHATLFFFDACRGFVKDADVLGPKDADAESYTQYRDPAGVTPSDLAKMVELVRAWEGFMVEGKEHAHRAEWEQALKALDKALSLCSDSSIFPNAPRYRHLVQGELGSVNRRFGRYEQAKDILETAITEMGTDESSGPQRVEFSGELGVVYRHMNRLEEAKRALQMQYDTALSIDFRTAACRAVGNLGMVNYQISQQVHLAPNESKALLDAAIKQLEERVETARRLKSAKKLSGGDDAPLATLWESIGLARLSLCYAAAGETRRGVEAAQAACVLVSESPDPTVVAMSHLFLGRALLRDGERARGLAYFVGATLPAGRCTPAIALCKEPSAEHRAYLRELIDETASSIPVADTCNGTAEPSRPSLDLDLDAVDENGYTALEYCVFNGDAETEAVVVEALRRQLYARADRALVAKRAESRLRRGYRELFQEKLRPVLLLGRRGSISDQTEERGWQQCRIDHLRRVYADAIAFSSSFSSPSKSDSDVPHRYDEIFDVLKFIPYREFEALGRLPGSRDGLVRNFVSSDSTPSKLDIDGEGGATSKVDFIVFISYRWINKTPGATSPDDDGHTQYNRMLAAAEAFLRLHPEVNKDRLGLWVDYACVDQSNPMPGVSALPMIVAQCNALISLVDSDYYDRAWCCVEVMMVQALQRAYGLHHWYEQVAVVSDETPTTDTRRSKMPAAEWVLRQGPVDMEIVMAKKDLTFEADRPNLLFLERQTKLLG